MKYLFPLTLVALSSLPATAQTQYGQPITEAPSQDLICYMESGNGMRLDLAKLCGGNTQAAATAPRRGGLVFSNISFRNPTSAEREVRNVGLKIYGRITNTSAEPIEARVIDYNVSAFNGTRWGVLFSASEYLADDFDKVTLQPRQTISFMHELNRSQASRFRGYQMDVLSNFSFQATGTRDDFIGIDPRP